MDRKSWIIVGLTGIIIFLLWLHFGGEKIDIGGDLIKQRMDSVIAANDRLLDKVASSETVIAVLKKKNVDLEKQAVKIKIKYRDRYVKIKELTSKQLSQAFDSVFAGAGIKPVDPVKDSSICFSQDQGKFLLGQNTKVSELDTLLKIKKVQYENCQEVVRKDSLAKVDLMQVHTNDKEVIGLQATQVLSLANDNRKLRNAIVWQKVQKWIAVAIIPVAIYVGYRAAKTL